MITSAADERVQGVSVTDDELVVAFIDGRTLSVPLVWYPRLLHASPEQRNDWRLIGDGEGVHWPQIDEDLSAAGLLHGFSDPAVRQASPPDLREQLETGEKRLAREFLNEAFSRYQSGTERATESGSEVTRTAYEMAEAQRDSFEALAENFASAQRRSMGVVNTSAFPIASYDEMNVEEATKRLNDLSVEELQLVRDYEERNKNRETLLEQMDRKIRAS